LNSSCFREEEEKIIFTQENKRTKKSTSYSIAIFNEQSTIYDLYKNTEELETE